jgi:hypothetical protein
MGRKLKVANPVLEIGLFCEERAAEYERRTLIAKDREFRTTARGEVMAKARIAFIKAKRLAKKKGERFKVTYADEGRGRVLQVNSANFKPSAKADEKLCKIDKASHGAYVRLVGKAKRMKGFRKKILVEAAKHFGLGVESVSKYWKAYRALRERLRGDLKKRKRQVKEFGIDENSEAALIAAQTPI